LLPQIPNGPIKFLKFRKIKILMVTDADFEYTIRTTSALKILDDFNYIITAEGVRSPKPNAQIFIKALLLADCPEKAFFIGDSDRRDIMGVKSIGLGTIRIKDYLSEKKETSADDEAGNFYKVIDIIESELC
jgi:FMN phosphatase YigB (HAD superfamily)